MFGGGDRIVTKIALTVMYLIGQAVAAEPALPFLDFKACPFEGCAYREWTARTSAPVYNSWKEDRRQVAQIVAGDKVTGIMGVVITFRPGLIRLDRDFPEQSLKRGDVILTYSYRGEGFSAAWVNGKYEPEFDISFAKWPDGSGCGGAHCAATYLDLGNKAWWAQVRLASGKTGWIAMDGADFDYRTGA